MKSRGNPKHGGHGTLTYMRWKSMMQRCNNPKATNYKYYGGAGIKVCARWRDFPYFLEDMGECPGRAMTLDRIKNGIGYQPGNCRWATQASQNQNRPSHQVRLAHDGRELTLTEWSRFTGLSINTIRSRLHRLGWPTDKALTTPTLSR